MDILGVGPLELLFLILIALVVIGPRDIGKAARSIGRFLNQLYRSETWRMLTETSRKLRNLPNQLAQEAALETSLDDVRQTVKKVGQEIAQDVSTLDEDLQVWKKPPPNSELSPGESQPPIEKPSDTEANQA
ncbi:MAG: twin-arginine translocase TatA/TatE family subunit [Anaerolineales bacterium]|nr:twin-arginine translocase TatA/TatE family subunit [Anaerolineales bacterium]